MGNDLPVKRVPERVVAPLSYSLMDLACPVVAAQDSFFPVPPGDVHMGGAPPDLVKNTSLAKALVVGGFSECASILTSDPLMDLGCPTGAVLGCTSPVSSGGSPPSLKMCSLLGPDTTLHLGGSYEPAVTMQNDLLVKRVPDRVVAPLSYSLKDLPCPL